MAKAKLILYRTQTCPWCQLAEEFLSEKHIPFEQKDIGEDDKARAEMIGKSGQMAVPVFDINGKIIVGFDADAIQKALEEK